MHRVDPESECGPMSSRSFPRRHPFTVLAYDVYKRADELVIEFDVPGIDPSRIEITLEGRTLAVSVDRQLAHGDGIDVIDCGRAHGTFSERLLLGNRWDPTGIRAHIEHGVLSVRAPMAGWHARSIPLEEGSEASSDNESGWAKDVSADARVSSAA